jgi:hypothetical protein
MWAGADAATTRSASCGVAPRPAHLRAAPFGALGRGARSRAAVVLSGATEASEESERVVLAKLELEGAAIAAQTQIKMSELAAETQVKMEGIKMAAAKQQTLVRSAVVSVALVTLGIIFAQSAVASAWLQKLVSEPLTVAFTTLVSLLAVCLAPFAAWLQGLFKENRESIEQSVKKFTADLMADRQASNARFEQSRQESNARFVADRQESNARFEQSNARFEQSRQESNARFEQSNARFEQSRQESNARVDSTYAILIRIIEGRNVQQKP